MGEMTEQARATSPLRAIVGIGASAGGLRALEAFFAAADPHAGIGYVVIQHLSRDHKSMMPDLLARRTEMVVVQAEHDMTVQPDHVYLIPSGQDMTIAQGMLKLTPYTPSGNSLHLPVDLFLESLAEDQEDLAVAVILSGSGSDGARGVRAVKEAGGLVLVQDDQTAEFTSMPRAAAATHVADFILAPGHMPEQIVACLEHPQSRQVEPVDESGLNRIFSLLKRETLMDFNGYRSETLWRRINRRIVVTQSPNLDEYVHYLESHSEEIHTLHAELLIGVTRFFRDPAAIQTLRDKVLPALLQRSTSQPSLRLWVAGCSTGEEAYSLAVLILETMRTLGIQRDVKIFATDIDRTAIRKAAYGIYPASIAADVPPELLERYFVQQPDQYQVSSTVRDLVVFAQHNVIRDPPFTRIDLICCRNVLIYLQHDVQTKIMHLFHYSLQPHGFLMLGGSETTGDAETLFEPVHRAHRIYQPRGELPTRPAPEMPPERLHDFSLGANDKHTAIRAHESLLDRLITFIQDKFLPFIAVVNERREVLYAGGDKSGFLNVPRGSASLDILRWVDPALSPWLASGIRQASQSNEEVRFRNVPLTPSESARVADIVITPLPGNQDKLPLYAIVLESRAVDRLSGSADTEQDVTHKTRFPSEQLERELEATRRDLQATVEELETTNEELQATNEELLASNEELQSSNEELQSANEELYTVNSEHQSKIIELTQSQNDVDNLLTSSRIGTVILDEDLRIRRFSPQAADVFRLVDEDVGRPLGHFAAAFRDHDVENTARHVVETEEIQECRVESPSGKPYLLRVLPYRVGTDYFAGVVITVVELPQDS